MAEPTEAAREELCQQLAVLDESARRILVILAGVALSLRALLLQRGALSRVLCGETDAATPEVAPMRITSSLLILSSLFFFTKLSRQTLESAPPGSARCSAEIDYVGNLLVLSVALARLWDLLRKLPEGADTSGATTDAAGAVDSELTIA